jgi:sugar phosphate isomerase/epimerase
MLSSGRRTPPGTSSHSAAGHDAVYWSTWLAALHAVDPDMCVNIEHKDVSLGRIEGLEVASKVLFDAARRAGLSTSDAS